jgi:hypothetical protein
MATQAPAPLRFDTRTVDELTIEDERSFRGIGLYADLKEVLKRDKYPFRVLPRAMEGRWDRAVLLNLTYWGAEAGGDVLTGGLDADVLTHAAWHHLAAKALPRTGGVSSAESLFLGESIASAFDAYLVGRLLGCAPDAAFLATQVPAMADAAAGAGLSEDGFEALVTAMADAPERCFEELRELLYDATKALHAAGDAASAMTALAAFDDRRFAPLLHHYELSNWVLYARAYGSAAPDARAAELDLAMRAAKDGALDVLTKRWL